MKARTLHPTQGVKMLDGGKFELFDQPVGTILDHPDCWQLVKMGAAEPADDECGAKCGMTAEQVAERSRHYEALDKGILVEHRELFFAGKITGYDGETGEFLVTDKFTAEDAAEFPNETPAELLADIDDEDEDDQAEETPATHQQAAK